MEQQYQLQVRYDHIGSVTWLNYGQPSSISETYHMLAFVKQVLMNVYIDYSDEVSFKQMSWRFIPVC